jgi:hypothetical protein
LKERRANIQTGTSYGKEIYAYTEVSMFSSFFQGYNRTQVCLWPDHESDPSVDEIFLQLKPKAGII